MDRSPEILRAAHLIEQRMRLERKLKRKVRRIETKEILASISPDRRAKLAKALKLYDGDHSMNLYNCKHADGGYRLTKFTKDYEVESSYVVSAEGCDCPAGIRPVCRHHTMLPFFLEHDHVDDGWFFIWDTRQWLPPIRPQGAPSTAFPQTETTTIEYGIEQHVTSDEPSQSCGDAAQPAPPTVQTPIAPQKEPASAEGAGFRFRRPNL